MFRIRRYEKKARNKIQEEKKKYLRLVEIQSKILENASNLCKNRRRNCL